MKILQRTDTAEGVAVTVDWVVLAAAIVGVAIAVLTSMYPGGEKMTNVTGNDHDEAVISSGSVP